MTGIGYVSENAEFPRIPDPRRACGNCGHVIVGWDAPDNCPSCGWRWYATCERCGGKWPRFMTPKTKLPDGPDKDALRIHRRGCPNRPLGQVVRNIPYMTWRWWAWTVRAPWRIRHRPKGARLRGWLFIGTGHLAEEWRMLWQRLRTR